MWNSPGLITTEPSYTPGKRLHNDGADLHEDDSDIFKQPLSSPVKKIKVPYHESSEFQESSGPQLCSSVRDSTCDLFTGCSNVQSFLKNKRFVEGLDSNVQSFLKNKRFVEGLEPEDSIYTSYIKDDIDCPTYSTSDSRFRKRMFKFCLLYTSPSPRD